MDVYIIRHAQALDRSAPIDDSHRPLTLRGRKDALRLGRGLQREAVVLDAIVMSPLVRAVETAELLAVAMEFEGALEVAPELGPARDPIEVVREVLLPRANLNAVAVVGHEPQLGALLALLLRSTEAIEPAKATAIRLKWRGPEEPAKVKWVLRANLEAPSKELADVEKRRKREARETREQGESPEA